MSPDEDNQPTTKNNVYSTDVLKDKSTKEWKGKKRKSLWQKD